MKLIKPGYEILSLLHPEDIIRNIEFAGRTCYKSESKMTVDSADKFVRMLY